MLDGKFVDKTRMTMGHRASPQTAQRLTFVVAWYLLEAFSTEFPPVLWEKSLRTGQGMVWIEGRERILGELKGQIRPILVSVLQNDFSVSAVLEEVANLLEE